mgnify:FL=1
MSNDDIDRKIAVIFATDLVGYSKHMEKDENATLRGLRECNKIIETIIKKQKGRIFNTGGDSVFAEFPSAVAAVDTAVEFQKQIKDRNEKDTTDIKLEYRIGINMGDVVKEGENLLGDGVNIAARLEALAQSGGITISKNVYDLVVNKTNYEFNDLGIQKVKQNQFHAYDLLLGLSQKRKLKTQSANTKLIAMIGSAIAAVFIGLFFSGILDTEQKLDSSKIVILPFKSLSETKKEKMLALGISQDLGSKLTKSSKMINVLNLKKTPENLKEVSNNTNASYLVDGNLIQIDNMLRVKVDLLDGKSITNIWSETYDRDLTGKNIFKLQDEITKQIINELVGAGAVLSKDINQKIASSSTDDISIYECINLARNSQTVISLRPKAFECLKESVKKDPNYADAWIWLAERTRNLYASGNKDKVNALLEDAVEYINKALIIDPESPKGLTVKTMIEFHKKNWETMFVSAEKAFSLNAGDPSVLSNLAVNVAFGGECTLNDVTSQDEQTKNINKKKCQFHRGCWDMGLKAHELDTGNVVTMDNYMLAACYNIVKDGANALKMMSPMPHKKRFWYEIHSGVASHFDGKFEIAQDHFENVKKTIESNKLPKIYDIFKKWNNERLSYPVYEEVLLKYGFE